MKPLSRPVTDEFHDCLYQVESNIRKWNLNSRSIMIALFINRTLVYSIFMHEVRVLWGYNIFIFNIHRILHRFRAISRKIYSRIFLLFVFELSYKYYRIFACTKIHSHVRCLVVNRYQLCTVYHFFVMLSESYIWKIWRCCREVL